MNRILLLLTFFLTANEIISQTKPPVGPAFDKVLKHYTNRDVNGVKQNFGDLEKAYPTHPYTKFFHAYINDQTGADIEGALREYSEVIRIAPDISDAYVYRSMIFSEKGLDEKSIADITKAIDIDKDASPAYYYRMRGEYYYYAKDYGNALADFKKAISVNPADIKAFRGLVNTSLQNNTAGDAAAFLENALNGKSKENADIRIVYADLLLRTEKHTDADKQFSAALATPGFTAGPKDLNSAGIAAYKLKEYSRASQLFDKAMKLDPRDIGFVFNRASVAIDEKKWEEVYTYAKTALQIDDNHPMANMYMAIGIKRTGRGDALAAEYEARARKLEAAAKQ